MSTVAIAALALAVVLGVFLLWRVNQPLVAATVRTADKARWALGLIFLPLAAYHLLRSGNILYIGLALAGFAFVTGYALVERPWESVI